MRIQGSISAGAVAVVLATGCRPDGPTSFGPIAQAALGEPAIEASGYGEWSAPVRLAAPINTAAIENGPQLSRDGRSLYFASTRTDEGAQGSQDIWVAHRCDESDVVPCEWRAPVNLGPNVNGPRSDAGPELSRDGHWLYFTSARGSDPARATNDIWVSWRADPSDDLAWTTAVRLEGDVNSPLFEAGPSVWGPELYFALGTGFGANGAPADIYVRDATGEVHLVEELSVRGPTHDQRPSVRFDGREIFLTSNRSGNPEAPLATEDVWVSTRAGYGQAWAVPVNLGSLVNSPFREATASISEDGTTLLFSSDRPLTPGSTGNFDIWVSTRSRRGAAQP